MMKLMTMKSRVGGALAALFLAGAALADTNGLNQIDPHRGFSNVWRAYVDMDEPYVRNGTTRSVEQIRRIAVGHTKQQVMRDAGQPVSANQDGSWNFDINLPLPQRNELVCQYRVYFDADDRVTGSVWRRPQCAEIVVGRLDR